MSIGTVTFLFALGCLVFFIAAAGFFSALWTKPRDCEVRIVARHKDDGRQRIRLGRPA